MPGTPPAVLIPCVVGAILLTGVGNILLLLVLRQLRVETLQFSILRRMAIGHTMYSLVFGAQFLPSLFDQRNMLARGGNLPCSILGAMSDTLNCFLAFEMLLYTIERYYITKNDDVPVKLKNHEKVIHSLPVVLSIFFSMFLLFDTNSYSSSQDLSRCSSFMARIPFVVSLFTWVLSSIFALIVTSKMLSIPFRMKNTTRVMPFRVSNGSNRQDKNGSDNGTTKRMKVFSISASTPTKGAQARETARTLKVCTSTASHDLYGRNASVEGRTGTTLVRRSILAAVLSVPLLMLQLLQFVLNLAEETDKENTFTYGTIITAVVFCRCLIYPCLVLFKNKSMLMALKNLLCCNRTVAQSTRHSFRTIHYPLQPREEISVRIEEIPQVPGICGSIIETKTSVHPKQSKRCSSVRLSSLSSDVSSVHAKVMSVRRVTSHSRSSSYTADSMIVTVNGSPTSSVVSTVRSSNKSSPRGTVSLGDVRICKTSFSSY